MTEVAQVCEPLWLFAPWMDVALQEFGEREIPGPKDNARIQLYYEVSVGKWAAELHDEVAWCSAFAGFSMIRAGYTSTRSLKARSWLNYGVPQDGPRLGSLLVFWRGSPDGDEGHVAFEIGATPTHHLCLGGNQNNMVTIKPYPRERLLGRRWPTKRLLVA